MRPRPSAVAEVLIWWALLVGVWVTTLSGVTTSDMVAATGAGLLAAVLAWMARRAAGGRWRVDTPWATWFVVLPASVVADAVRLLALALRRPFTRNREEGSQGAGRLVRVPLPDDGNPTVAAGRRAAATVAVSATPGTFVVDVDDDSGELIVHRLVGGAPSMEKVVGR